MTVQIQVEPYSRELFNELMPLAQKCWHESTEFKAYTCAYYGERDFDIEPDAEAYENLHKLGVMTLLTLRDEGLKGYVIGFTYKSMHHKRILCAMGDTIYIEPEYRSYTGVLAEKFERALAEKGVAIIGWPVHRDGPVYEVLKARGYSSDDTVMEKRLCV